MDYESTKEGCITIKSVNTTTKKVVGTFQFTTVADTFDSSAPVNYTVTNGTFNYKYDN
ncbi:hypothetical protein [Flavobacterium sp.]|uniref:hypothetical protein n=1 Tax=Flavobacterium sp. TaxID=239 RepID=UPI0026120172|nr:hypothetical protein [Flavobacterium sp.]